MIEPKTDIVARESTTDETTYDVICTCGWARGYRQHLSAKEAARKHRMAHTPSFEGHVLRRRGWLRR